MGQMGHYKKGPKLSHLTFLKNINLCDKPPSLCSPVASFIGYMEKITYCLYARKSSESDERQALSIDSQIAEMQKIATKQGLKIVETIQESK